MGNTTPWAVVLVGWEKELLCLSICGLWMDRGQLPDTPAALASHHHDDSALKVSPDQLSLKSLLSNVLSQQ